ncbi:MAG: molybdate ABC transporter substrate-binding protein, partial [Proteobacteria bacterium]|nr:molybdate ABC transporter substrate-binding protein [Pseudomonadota bacterium]
MAVAGSGAESITVFAAASTTNAITEIGKMFSEQNKVEFIPSFASSSTLAKQIENQAPANLYISANYKWMDYLKEKKIINNSSRFDLLS